MDENGPKCMKERVLEHRDRSLVAPKDDDRSNNAAQLGCAPPHRRLGAAAAAAARTG